MADIAELIVALKLRDGVSGGLGKLNGQLKGLQGNMAQFGKGVGQVGRGVDKIATRAAIAVAGLGTAIITNSASIEQASAGIRKTVEGDVEAVIGDIKNLSRQIPLSFEELAGIAAEGGALGIATDSLVGFTDVVARLAVSTDLTAEQASSSLGQLANVLKLSDDDLHDFGDSLVALGNDGASTESQILDMAARFGAAGKQAGLSSEAILALASTTASMGIEAEAGGGALSRIFNGITLDIATTSKESELLADSMGLSLGELRAAWDKDAGKVFQELLGYISKLDKFEAAEFLTGLGITNTRDINALTLLAEGADEYGRQLGVATGQTDELNKESDAFFNTTEGKWKIFQNNVALAGDAIGSKLLPVVNDVLEDLVTMLNDPKVQKGLTEFGENLAGGLRSFIAEIKKTDFTPLIETLKGAAGIAKTAFDAFNALPGPIKQVLLAAIVANKVTGGALGDITKGLGNIAGAGIKLLFERGSPTNPMFVVPLGGGLGGGGGLPTGGPGGGGLGGIVKQALKIALPLFAVGLAQELVGSRPWWEAPDSKNLRGPTLTKTPGRAGGDAAGADAALLAKYAPKLDKLATNEVIKHLERTNEIGQKGIGSSFQFGIKDGLDPVGDVATRILARAEDPKAPAVMFEIGQHIAGLEEIQQTYLNNGDVKLAEKVQTNIDTLNGLLGKTDQHRAVTERLAAQAVSSDTAMLATANRQVEEQRSQKAHIDQVRDTARDRLNNLAQRYTDVGGGTNARLDTANAHLVTLAGKNWSPIVKVNQTNTVSSTVIQQKITQQRAVTGTGFTSGSRY